MKLLYFKNDKCNVCKRVLEKIEQFTSHTDIPLEVIDIEENPEIAGQKLVFTVPTVIIIHEDSEIKRFTRNFSITEIEYTVERYKELIS